MARRGEQLREHILLTAKELFQEVGFERASMDEVAARAETSKRSLYAHFESKENLYLAVIDLLRELFLGKLKTPGDYPGKPAEALTLFCARYLEILMHRRSMQMCRLSISETVRFPQAAAQHFDVMFTEAHKRIAAYLKAAFELTPKAAGDAAHRLMGQLLYPRLMRALFGIDPVPETFDHTGLSPDYDLKPVRKAVTELIAELEA